MTTAVTSRQSDRPDIRVQLLSNPAYLCAVRELVGLVAKRSGFPDSHAARIVLAVDEALANVMNHGYEKRSDGLIDVAIHKDTDPATGALAALRIVIEDEGKQTDPAKIKSRDLDDIRPGGLGVHIIKEVMDSVQYQMRPSVGMRLTMVKRLPPPTQVPPVAPAGTCGCTTSSTLLPLIPPLL